MLTSALDIEKHQRIEKYFSNLTASKRKFAYCDESGKMPCFYWKKDTQIVSREYDEEEYVWKVYNSPDFLASDITKKIIEISEAVLKKLSDPIFFPDVQYLQIKEILSSNKDFNLRFTIEEENQPKELSREKDFFDFFLKVSLKKERKIDDYIKSRMKELHTEAPLVYYKLKSFFQESGLKLDPGLSSFNEKCSKKSISHKDLLFDLKEDEEELISWDIDGTILSLIKPEKGTCFFGIKQNGSWKAIDQVWVYTPIGSFLGNKNIGDIVSNYEFLKLLEFEKFENGFRALFNLKVETSIVDPTQIIYPSKRGIFAVKCSEGYFLYIEDPYKKNPNKKRFLILLIPLVFSKLESILYDDRYDVKQQITSFHKCSFDKINEIFNNENDKVSLYSKCFELLNKKDGNPLVFIDPSLKTRGSKEDIESQKAPLIQLLNRTYCWYSSKGELVFCETKKNETIWTIIDADGNQHIPKTIEFKNQNSENVELLNKDYVLLFESLRLDSISPKMDKIIFKIIEQKSSIDKNILVLPNQWNLTYIIYGSTSTSLDKFGNIFRMHARVYLQTPASQNIIEIHLTNVGLLIREISYSQIQERIRKRSQVVPIFPRLEFIQKILQDLDNKIHLHGTFNCSYYALKIFEYAGRPTAKDNLNPFDQSWNPLSHGAAKITSDIKELELQEQRKLQSLTINNTTLSIYEKANNLNYFYYVYAKNSNDSTLLFSETSGFQFIIEKFEKNDEGVNLVLSRAGICGLFPWLSIKKHFSIKQ